MCCCKVLVSGNWRCLRLLAAAFCCCCNYCIDQKLTEMSGIIGTIGSNQAKTAVIAALALAALTAAAFRGKKSIIGGGDPALTEDGTVFVMNKILEKLKFTAVRMVRAAENIRQQIAQQGQQIDDERLMKMFILPHFDSGFKELQDAACDEYDVDEEELEHAVDYYIAQGNEELKEIAKKIKIIFRQFGGDIEIDEDVSSADAPTREISLESLIEFIQKMEIQFSADTETFIETFQNQFGPPNTPQLAELFQQKLMMMSEVAEKSIMEEEGISPNDFQAAVIAHQSDPRLQQTLMMMQMNRRMTLQQHGIEMM